MLRHSSRNTLPKFITERLTGKRTQLVTLLAIFALGIFLLSLSSVAVHSRGLLPSRSSDAAERTSGLATTLAEDRTPVVLDAAAKSREFTKLFSAKDVALKSEPGSKLNHRASRSTISFSPLLPSIMATKTDALFVGTDPGSKVDEARKHGVSTHSGDVVRRIMET